MAKTHPISIAAETHGLAGNLVLPEAAAPESPVPAAVVVGGPGPVPLQRYTISRSSTNRPQGAKPAISRMASAPAARASQTW